MHSGPAAAAAAAGLRANAFTYGSHIAFAAGRYAPHTAEGRQLLTHELVHVAQQARSGPRVQRQASDGTPADSQEKAAQEFAAREAARTKVRDDTRADARRVREILTGNTWLGSGNQAEIMEIVRRWGSADPVPGTKLSAMDYLIMALQTATYDVGLVVKQQTTAFDEMHRRMSDENVDEFKKLMAVKANTFKNEKPQELVKFEVTKEDVVRGVKVGLEATAAIATAGGSVLLQIGLWLVGTLPDLWEKAKAIVELIQSVRNFKKQGASSLFGGAELGDILVKALFGELQVLPSFPGTDPPEGALQGEGKGFMKLLQMMIRGFMALKRAYNKVAQTVNGLVGRLDISKQPWLKGVAAAYYSITTIKDIIEDPGRALGDLAKALHDKIATFFGGIKTKITETANEIKAKLELVLDPEKLLHMLADKAVEMVLNFIVTHSPSAIVSEALKIIEGITGKDIIQLVREKVPLGDQMIKKIAESKVVQGAIEPLHGPVDMAIEAVTAVTDKATGLVTDAETRIESLASESTLRDLAGMGPAVAKPTSPAPAGGGEGEAEKPADFLSAVKAGLHVRLMAIGKSAVVAGAKDLAQKGFAAVKAAAVRAGRAIFGKRVPFKAAMASHEIWAEQQESGALVLFMASGKPVTIAEKLNEYETQLKLTSDQINLVKAARFGLSEASGVPPDPKALPAAMAQLETREKELAKLIAELEPLLVGGGKVELKQDGKNRPILSAAPLQKPGNFQRDEAAQEAVSGPLNQLMTAMGLDTKYHAAHLVAHRFGGDPGLRNLVPIEGRINTSYMKISENQSAELVENAPDRSLYAVARAFYNDPPEADLKAAKAMSDAGAEALLRVPDDIQYTVTDTRDGKVRISESFPTGGPLLAFLGRTRRKLTTEDPDLAKKVLDKTEREKLTDEEKRKTAAKWAAQQQDTEKAGAPPS